MCHFSFRLSFTPYYYVSFLALQTFDSKQPETGAYAIERSFFCHSSLASCVHLRFSFNFFHIFSSSFGFFLFLPFSLSLSLRMHRFGPISVFLFVASVTYSSLFNYSMSCCHSRNQRKLFIL